MNRIFLSRTVLLALLLLALPAAGQVTPEEHASHHPDQATEENADAQPGEGESSESSGGMMGGSGGGMGSMMEQMGAPKPKDLYPSLMNLPDLSPEEMEEFKQQAKERTQAGIVLMTEALDDMLMASADDDFESMQAAAVVFREGFARFESGLATQQFLSEGRQPEEIALDWFRREMNILQQPAKNTKGPLGLSWFHFITMTVLVLFGIATIWLYFAKMRRASSLIARLTEAESSRPPNA